MDTEIKTYGLPDLFKAAKAVIKQGEACVINHSCVYNSECGTKHCVVGWMIADDEHAQKALKEFGANTWSVSSLLDAEIFAWNSNEDHLRKAQAIHDGMDNHCTPVAERYLEFFRNLGYTCELKDLMP